MLARPVSSFVADLWSWRAIFRISAVLMAGLFLVLRFWLPPRQPTPDVTYGELLHYCARDFLVASTSGKNCTAVGDASRCSRKAAPPAGGSAMPSVATHASCEK
jgi:MFS family permease